MSELGLRKEAIIGKADSHRLRCLFAYRLIRYMYSKVCKGTPTSFSRDVARIQGHFSRLRGKKWIRSL
jgi:hypothetical protein